MFHSIFLIALPGGSEWVLIFLAVLLLFGGKKIPELMQGIGKGIREFNDAKDRVKADIESGMNAKDNAAPSNNEESSNAAPSQPAPTAQAPSQPAQEQAK